MTKGEPASESALDTTVVVVPALDEGGNIGDLVRDVLDEGVKGVVVANNGSTDNTAAEAAAAGAVVVEEIRRGYGWACLAGTNQALADGAEFVVYIDADHSSRPAELCELLEPLRNNQADLVLGSRATGNISSGAMAMHQRLGNWLCARLMRRLYDIDITDLGPYRAIRHDLVAKLDMQEMTFGWPTEMMVKCANHGARIVEVPVTWDPRRSGKSKVSGTIKGSILAARHIVGVTIRYSRT